MQLRQGRARRPSGRQQRRVGDDGAGRCVRGRGQRELRPAERGLLMLRVPAEEALNNVRKLLAMSGYEEEVFPIVDAYVSWVYGVDPTHEDVQEELEKAFEYLRKHP